MMKNKAVTEYGPEAYRPDKVKAIPGENMRVYRFWWSEKAPLSTLPWGHYYNREAADTLEVTKPEGILYNLVRMLSTQKRVLIPPEEKWWLNQMFPGPRIWSLNHHQMLFKGSSLLSIAILICLGLYIGSLVADSLLYVGSSLREVSTLRFLGVALSAGLTALVLMFLFIQLFSFPPKYFLDRTTGMITIRRLLWPSQHVPFTHFDVLIKYIPETRRFVGYLCCRYKRTLLAFSRTEHAKSVYLVWQFIQRFMDVSQPLPDIPSLEPYRHLDPTTAAHDRETGRPERYWRDQSMEEINDIAAKMAEEEKDLDLKPVWPCTLAPFIEGRNPKKPTFFPKSKEGGR